MNSVLIIFIQQCTMMYMFIQVQPVIWRENQPPGPITKLIAKDNDGPDNGPPFSFSIASSASSEIQSKFGVNGQYIFVLIFL